MREKMTGALETKIAVMVGVREHCEQMPVELWITESGRFVVRAWNECGNNCTDVDLVDLLEWMRGGSSFDDRIAFRPPAKRDKSSSG